MTYPLRNIGLPGPGGVDFDERIFAEKANESFTNGDFCVLEADGTI